MVAVFLKNCLGMPGCERFGLVGSNKNINARGRRRENINAYLLLPTVLHYYIPLAGFQFATSVRHTEQKVFFFCFCLDHFSLV